MPKLPRQHIGIERGIERIGAKRAEVEPLDDLSERAQRRACIAELVEKKQLLLAIKSEDYQRFGWAAVANRHHA